MKRILIITTHKRLLLCLTFFLLISVAILLVALTIHFNKCSQVFNDSEINGIQALEKENSMLKNLFSSLIPKEQKIIIEDDYRNIFMNSGVTPPPPLPTSALNKVIAQGEETKFRILSDDPQYLRPLYEPSWKETYYRAWLYLPYKNIEARHRIFAFSLGASANYDIFGSLGLNLKSSPNAPIDNHHNINFLIYGFKVSNIKVFQNQVALIGELKLTGAQIVSIVQNDLLPEGVDTKDFLFQLSTPKGYEVDYLNHNIIRYEYLMKEIKEHTVTTVKGFEGESKSIEQLISENSALKLELSYFIPLKDEVILQQNCKSLYSNLTNITIAIQNGSKIPITINYNNLQYKRPLYDPSWKVNYKRKWCYIPKQIENNLHRLFAIPQNYESRTDFFGTLGFYEKYTPIKSDRYGFMVYNFDVSDAVIYRNHLLFVGTPYRNGAQIVSINRNSIKGYDNYLIRLVTPDDSEIDCNVLTP